MKPEKQQLIDDLLRDDGRRDATLLAGARILRRRRQRRVAMRGLALVIVLGLAGFWFERINSPSPSAPPPTPIMATSKSPQPQALTDEELLALFPNTPVGLATLSDGRKRLIFPRAGDEQKFVTRL